MQNWAKFSWVPTDLKLIKAIFFWYKFCPIKGILYSDKMVLIFTSRTSDKLEARNWFRLSPRELDTRDDPEIFCGKIRGSFPLSKQGSSSDVCDDNGDNFALVGECCFPAPVPGRDHVSSSGSGSSLNDEGGLATWFVEPE